MESGRPTWETLAPGAFVIGVASQVFFLLESQPVWEGRGCGKGSPWGGRASLTSCLWPLSCWWMPFAELELLMACKESRARAE